MNRREALQMVGAGFGTVAPVNVLQAEATRHRLALKAPHFPAKAKHIIFLFLNGGMSQVDTFDPKPMLAKPMLAKPMLAKMDGQPLPGPKIETDRASGNLMASPFQFKKYGQSGIEVSETGQVSYSR